ncbi:hypothetical protein [Halotalea alkalilenta]|uniref:hypothetical protein n=1 Tax=Halotalea alkalilenta TaxID=376489 RepID=UPI000487CCA8|nr:hypothetical protein [Halotalea alkalilenta]
MKESNSAEKARHDATGPAAGKGGRPSRFAPLKDVRLLIVGVAVVVIVLFFVFAVASLFE